MTKPQTNYDYFLKVFLVIWIFIFLFNYTFPDNLFTRFEFDTLTFLTTQKPKTDSSIVIVAIDEPSFAELKLQWPWPRTIYAQLIHQLKKNGAAIIAMDIGYYEKSTDTNEDIAFAKAIEQAKNIVLPSYTDQTNNQWISQTRTVYPILPFIKAGAHIGNVTVNLDDDGVFRKLPSKKDAFWTVIYNLDQHITKPTIDKNNNKLIRYSKPELSFRKVSFYQALEPDIFLPADYFKNTIVLIGYMNTLSSDLSKGFQDTYKTPLSRFTGKPMFGTEIHAHLIHSALNQLHLSKANTILQAILFTLTVLASWLAYKTWHPIINALLAICICLLIFGFSVLSFFKGIWYPFTYLISGIWIIYLINGGIAYYNELSLRIYLRKAFSRYVSDNIINLIISDPKKLNLGGEREEVSFIFTDIADFTPLTENTPASILVDLINDYFEGMSRIVLSYNGTIERFVGDALVVFFNAPIKQADHPCLSVKCALEMNDFGLRFSKQQYEKGVPFGKTRLGVHTGIVSVGNFGGKKRFHYTAMGDAINVASRLENANKIFGTSICVSHITSQQCHDIAFRPIGEFCLKGKSKSQLIMEPLDKNNFSKAFLQQYLHAYSLIKQDNIKAKSIFEELLRQNPDDYLVNFHLNRLKNNTENKVSF